MEPTFHNGEMLIVNKVAYRSFDISWLPWSDNENWRPFGEPQPGDVVVFRFPQNPSRDFIKRVVAVAGQTVEVRGGQVIVDGVVQDEPYLEEAPSYEYGPITVAEGQYFVLGDNRNNSYDSHAWGTLDKSFLIGRADIRYWPLDRAGRLEGEAPRQVPEVGVSRSQ
jgi:signal peptidase I